MTMSADEVAYGLEILATRREKLIKITLFLDETVRSARRRGRSMLADRCAFHGDLLRSAIMSIERRMALQQAASLAEAHAQCVVLENWVETGVPRQLVRSVIAALDDEIDRRLIGDA
jgi:hypothetical protein